MKKTAAVQSLIERSARLAGQPLARARIDDLNRALQDCKDDEPALAVLRKAWHAAGFHGSPGSIRHPGAEHLPFAGWHPARGWFIAVARNADQSWTIQDMAGQTATQGALDDAECFSIPGKPQTTQHGAAAEVGKGVPKAFDLVRQALASQRSIFIESVLATFLINILALTTSLYSMQVYDRVIPNHGFQTLWVLSAGVFIAIVFELVLKHVRSVAIDKTCRRIDTKLSEWFFRRALGVRLESRPPSVGTLASQIRGFEQVRATLTSTTLFVIADIPFALFFMLVIFLIGGWVVLVPLIVLPVSLIAGLMFQRVIRRETQRHVMQLNHKTGLLVESIDGAESLKANAAEWKFQSRWNQMMREVGESDHRVKHYSAFSAHITGAIQQFGYVGLVAVGAYLATSGQLTMGGLIACSIISGRALNPIAQLPSILVQWANAQAALRGLDKVIALPNDLDEVAGALVPENLHHGLRAEGVHFAYGLGQQSVIDIPRLVLNPGERAGLIGPIGSGKSTLLKVAAGLYRPGSGKMFLGDIDMALLASGVVRERIGYLPQDVQLFSGTLRDNLLLGLPDPGDGPILEAARKTGLFALISNHPKGLALPIAEGGRGVSGGQRQLVGITRLLLGNPPIWLLDEPTASLDSASEARIVALLGEVAAGGATMLIASHKTALLPLLPRLIVVQDGRIAQDGPCNDVLAILTGKTRAPVSAAVPAGAGLAIP